jgi:hypothetical protein
MLLLINRHFAARLSTSNRTSQHNQEIITFRSDVFVQETMFFHSIGSDKPFEPGFSILFHLLSRSCVGYPIQAAEISKFDCRIAFESESTDCNIAALSTFFWTFEQYFKKIQKSSQYLFTTDFSCAIIKLTQRGKTCF